MQQKRDRRERMRQRGIEREREKEREKKERESKREKQQEKNKEMKRDVKLSARGKFFCKHAMTSLIEILVNKTRTKQVGRQVPPKMIKSFFKVKKLRTGKRVTLFHLKGGFQENN